MGRLGRPREDVRVQIGQTLYPEAYIIMICVSFVLANCMGCRRLRTRVSDCFGQKADAWLSSGIPTSAELTYSGLDYMLFKLRLPPLRRNG
jgi:hypothetical protein